VEQIINAATVPPLSEVAIYAHGWLTDVSDTMIIYDTLARGFDREARAVTRGLKARAATPAPPKARRLLRHRLPCRHRRW
jgi:hypothetical protein